MRLSRVFLAPRQTILRFLIAGVALNAIDFILYYVLFHFLSFRLSKGISFVCVSVLGYGLNKYWVYDHRSRSIAEGVRYLICLVTALGINNLTNQGILNAWPEAVLLAFVGASCMTGLWIALCFRWWVFPR